MKVLTQVELVEALDGFLARHPEIGEARFGRDATGEPGLVSSIRNGRSPTMRIAEKIAAYMAEKDAELAAVNHAGTDTIGSNPSSPGNSDEISAPPDPFASRTRRTDVPAPGGSANLAGSNGVDENPEGPTAASQKASCGDSPTSSPQLSRMCDGCSTAMTDAARGVAA